MATHEKVLPSAIAVAGFRGYIGNQVTQAALRSGVRVYGLDPRATPGESSGLLRVLTDEEEFYSLPVDVFHLALHPQARKLGQSLLLARAQKEPIRILMEKPMASPERPEDCQQVITSIEETQAIVLYNFPELYDPLTATILEFLREFRHVEIHGIRVQRSKDREADTERNRKQMVTIQYQESVHCLAFCLYLLGALADDYRTAVGQGVRVQSASVTYEPPNPEIYEHIVDGYCRYQIEAGGVWFHGVTDFTRGAPASKRRVIHGVGDGREFCIEAEYREGHKYLRINGKDQDVVPRVCSYESVLRTFSYWCGENSLQTLRNGVYPHPRFAQVTYQLSAMLWRSSFCDSPIEVANEQALLSFDSGYASALPSRLKSSR